jgi:hypothetical protein
MTEYELLKSVFDGPGAVKTLAAATGIGIHCE